MVYEGLDPVTGRERRRWHTAGCDRADAERLARQLADAEHARRGDGRSRLTFAGFVARYWLPAKRMQLRPTTIDGYERMLRLHILPALGSTTLRQLTPETIQDLHGRLLFQGRSDDRGGLSPKTVHEVHAVVRNVLDDAVRHGLVVADPARLAASPRFRRDQHRRRKAWTAEELRGFIEATAGAPLSPLVPAGCLYRDAPRWAGGVRWRDVDLDRQRLSIVRTVICVGARMREAAGKTPNTARTIDLDAATVALLAAWRAEHAQHFGSDDPNRWVFT